MREFEIHEQRANMWLSQMGQGSIEIEDRTELDTAGGFGNVVGDARKQIMGEWDSHMKNQIPEIVLFEPKLPGATVGDARKRISRNGGGISG